MRLSIDALPVAAARGSRSVHLRVDTNISAIHAYGTQEDWPDALVALMTYRCRDFSLPLLLVHIALLSHVEGGESRRRHCAPIRQREARSLVASSRSTRQIAGFVCVEAFDGAPRDEILRRAQRLSFFII